jgi:hypothetical protein
MSSIRQREKESARKAKAHARRLRKRKGRAALRSAPKATAHMIPPAELPVYLPP